MENEFEFIEPHAVCGSGGQQWPVRHSDRDAEILALIDGVENGQ